MAVSYGVYDIAANRGYVFVGTSHDTAEFAGDALALWWQREGINRYPHADRILILADCGGSLYDGGYSSSWLPKVVACAK